MNTEMDLSTLGEMMAEVIARNTKPIIVLTCFVPISGVLALVAVLA